MADSVNNLSARVSALAKWISVAGLVVMTVIVALQVFARYVLNNSPAWAEQAALLLMIWYVFIAAAAGVREGFHIRIGVFVERLPQGVRRPIELGAHLIMVAFGAAMSWYGVELAQATWQHVIPTLGLSRGYAYVPIALSGVLITAFSIERFVAALRHKEVKPTWN